MDSSNLVSHMIFDIYDQQEYEKYMTLKERSDDHAQKTTNDVV
jgi:acyl-CoA-binding protein